MADPVPGLAPATRLAPVSGQGGLTGIGLACPAAATPSLIVLDDVANPDDRLPGGPSLTRYCAPGAATA